MKLDNFPFQQKSGVFSKSCFFCTGNSIVILRGFVNIARFSSFLKSEVVQLQSQIVRRICYRFSIFFYKVVVFLLERSTMTHLSLPEVREKICRLGKNPLCGGSTLAFPVMCGIIERQIQKSVRETTSR